MADRGLGVNTECLVCANEVEKTNMVVLECKHELCSLCYHEILRQPSVHYDNLTGRITHFLVCCPWCRFELIKTPNIEEFATLLPSFTVLEPNWGLPLDDEDVRSIAPRMVTIDFDLWSQLQEEFSDLARSDLDTRNVPEEVIREDANPPDFPNDIQTSVNQLPRLSRRRVRRSNLEQSAIYTPRVLRTPRPMRTRVHAGNRITLP